LFEAKGDVAYECRAKKIKRKSGNHRLAP
jgi:hypothetical protein